MKDSQPFRRRARTFPKYIKANNERFSTTNAKLFGSALSISRRIMKDSQRVLRDESGGFKYIKANNERFSTSR